MGDAFDIRQFHDAVLKDGRLSLSLLEQKADAMIGAAADAGAVHAAAAHASDLGSQV